MTLVETANRPRATQASQARSDQNAGVPPLRPLPVPVAVSDGRQPAASAAARACCGGWCLWRGAFAGTGAALDAAERDSGSFEVVIRIVVLNNGTTVTATHFATSHAPDHPRAGSRRRRSRRNPKGLRQASRRKRCAFRLDDRRHGLLRRLARLQERRKVAAQPRVQRPVPVAVAIGGPLGRALAPSSAQLSQRESVADAARDQAVHVRFHRQLHHGLSHAAQEVVTSGFGQKLGQR